MAAAKAKQPKLASEALKAQLSEEAVRMESLKTFDFSTASIADISTLFPPYARIRAEYKAQNKKNISNAVNIEAFTLKTPFGDQTLLSATDLLLEPGKRQCLYGANSTGKTLLFHYISEGKIKDFPQHIHVHHCKELEPHELGDSTLDTVVNSHPLRRILVKCEAAIRAALAADPAPEGEAKGRLKDNLDYVTREMNSIRGYDGEERAAKMLRVLGFDDAGQKKPVRDLSGGLRMRVALCMAFFIDADLLLLDEPTNHLDFPSVLWLENRLRGYGKSFLVVSHDREMLNNVTTGTILIEDKKLKYYNCGFKEFETRKANEDKKKSDEIDKFLAKNRNPDPSTMLGRDHALKKAWLETYQARVVALQGKFTFPAAVELENPEKLDPKDISLIRMSDVRFSYDVKTNVYILGPANLPEGHENMDRGPKPNGSSPLGINFNVTASTRFGVMGPNGAGKSTFLKLLTGKLTPVTGTVVYHPKYTLAYFGQHSTAELDLKQTASEWMQHQFPEEKAGLLRAHLAKTSIVGTVADTRMERLSFSQRSCIIFSKLTYKCPHLLIMDEPTNFLDLESVDSLIQACNKYRGALLLVSHNRDFLRKCANGYLSIVPGQFQVFDESCGDSKQAMKKAEQATYTFIAEMEEGKNVKGSVDLTKSGGTVHASQRVGGATIEKKETTKGQGITISSAPSKVQAPADKKAAPPTKQAESKAGTPKSTATVAAATSGQYFAKEKVLAMWKDGKFYAAVVDKVMPEQKYQVTYTQYGTKAVVPASQIKRK